MVGAGPVYARIIKKKVAIILVYMRIKMAISVHSKLESN